jgi:hypothetical protein
MEAASTDTTLLPLPISYVYPFPNNMRGLPVSALLHLSVFPLIENENDGWVVMTMLGARTQGVQ